MRSTTRLIQTVKDGGGSDLYYRRTFLEEYEELAGTDTHGSFGGEFREEVGQFVINYIAAHGKSPSNREIIEACISEDERERLIKRE